MHLSSLEITNFRCIGSGSSSMQMDFSPGLTALVGANDAGKTAVIDALRFALGTSDLDRNWLQHTDFHNDAKQINVMCKFEKLGQKDLAAFVEYLTYSASDGEPILYVNWIAENTGEERRGRPHFRAETRSGKDSVGTVMSPDAKALLASTYLRPLRDVDEALSSGRGSRLSQVLKRAEHVKVGQDLHDPDVLLKDQKLSILGISKLLTELLVAQQGITDTCNLINTTLKDLALEAENLTSGISVSGSSSADESRFRELLEKLDLRLQAPGRMGLGSDNLLFMACELLLLTQEDVGNKMLLIEEPEAHLHAQRQLQVMKSLQKLAESKGLQIIVTTHSPNLASVIDLENLVIINQRKAFPLSEKKTLLGTDDRKFLQRFLDATKANLFFAYSVIIVEGDAENILIPTLARIMGRDLTSNGVSIVNVGGVGLGRYSRIFQRHPTDTAGELAIKVACITDLDVMPDLAPALIGWVTDTKPIDQIKNRRWKIKSEFPSVYELKNFKAKKSKKFDGQKVKTFVSDEWTLEYNIALGRPDESGKYSLALAKDVYIACCLADEDKKLSNKPAEVKELIVKAGLEYDKLALNIYEEGDKYVTSEEAIATSIYLKFLDGVSKPIAAQYLAASLLEQHQAGKLTSDQLRKALPVYLVEAIDYVTNAPVSGPEPASA